MRLGTIPGDEFVDGMSIAALRLGRTQAAKHSRFSLIQISSPSLIFGRRFFFPFSFESHIMVGRLQTAGLKPRSGQFGFEDMQHRGLRIYQASVMREVSGRI
jgi:hypothetical protein